MKTSAPARACCRVPVTFRGLVFSVNQLPPAAEIVPVRVEHALAIGGDDVSDARFHQQLSDGTAGRAGAGHRDL